VEPGVDPSPEAALKAARKLIADEARWTRSAPARRLRPARGRGKNRHEAEWLPTHATDPRAGRWCAAGALCAVSQMRSGGSGIEFLEAASRQLFGVGIGRANDDPRSTHTDMLRCYAVAITLAETAGMRASVP
jgi:hypothetical protein